MPPVRAREPTVVAGPQRAQLGLDLGQLRLELGDRAPAGGQPPLQLVGVVGQLGRLEPGRDRAGPGPLERDQLGVVATLIGDGDLLHDLGPARALALVLDLVGVQRLRQPPEQGPQRAPIGRPRRGRHRRLRLRSPRPALAHARGGPRRPRRSPLVRRHRRRRSRLRRDHGARQLVVDLLELDPLPPRWRVLDQRLHQRVDLAVERAALLEQVVEPDPDMIDGGADRRDQLVAHLPPALDPIEQLVVAHLRRPQPRRPGLHRERLRVTVLVAAIIAGRGMHTTHPGFLPRSPRVASPRTRCIGAGEIARRRRPPRL